MTERLDLAPLIDPIGRDAVRAYRQRAIASGAVPGGTGRLAAVALVVVFSLIVLGVILTIVRSTGGGGFTLFFIAFAALSVGIGVSRVFSPRPWRRWALLDRFAAANGMRFTPTEDGSAETGMIFGRGDDRRTTELMSLGDGWLDGRVETANYRYSVTTGSGKNRHTTVHRWAYLVIQLDRHLPQLVLDAVQNDKRLLGIGASDLPSSFARDQRLSLEGDFDRWFRLYAPEGYERDALYVLTPDLMALLIDQAGSGTALDVEIVDDRVYFYAPGHLDFTDPALWQRLTTIVRTIGAKTLKQTVRYADDRVGDRALDVVAPEGRRLRSGGALAAVSVVIGFAVIWWIAVNVFAR